MSTEIESGNQKTGRQSKYSDLLDRQAAAEFLGIKAQTLAMWAATKKHPLPYVKIGRLVKYRISDLEAFIKQNLK